MKDSIANEHFAHALMDSPTTPCCGAWLASGVSAHTHARNGEGKGLANAPTTTCDCEDDEDVRKDATQHTVSKRGTPPPAPPQPPPGPRAFAHQHSLTHGESKRTLRVRSSPVATPPHQCSGTRGEAMGERKGGYGWGMHTVDTAYPPAHPPGPGTRCTVYSLPGALLASRTHRARANERGCSKVAPELR